MLKTIYISFLKQSTDRKFLNFGTALKNAVDIISEAYKRDGKIAGILQVLMI